jgi:hypothetical protein
VFRWLDESAPFIRAIGGHPDDAIDSPTLRLLEYAKLTRDVNRFTRLYRARNWPLIWDGLRIKLLANAIGARHMHGALLQRAWDEHGKECLELTLCSLKVIVDAGVAAVVDAFTNTFEAETFNFHGVGTGGTAEGQTQTALVTELTTQLSPDNTRATGTQSQPSANIYQSLATTTYDSSQAITEHAIFSQAATGGGTMWDRSLFTVINATSIQHTYQGTFPANG